jgi:hypothetical protein
MALGGAEIGGFQPVQPPADEANLPPWLLAGAAAPPSVGTGTMPRVPRQPLPASELPPWLRQGGPAQGGPTAGAPGGWPRQPAPQSAAAAPQQPDSGDLADDFDPFADDFGEVPAAEAMDGADEDQAPEHYTDRFGDETPSGPIRFGYAYDHPDGPGSRRAKRRAAAGSPPEPAPRPEERPRRRLFGRK